MKKEFYKYPLKKIIEHIPPGVKDNPFNASWADKLECNHILMVASDMYGKRFPNKRRCRHCYKEG